MDIVQTRNVLRKLVHQFELDELEDLREDVDGGDLEESYTGTGGSFSHENAPGGDPVTGGESGVDNLDMSMEIYLGFLSETAMDVAGQCNISDDDALEALTRVAEKLAQEGMLSPMPDADTASSTEMSEWTGAAKTCGLVSKTIDYVKRGLGESPLHSS